MPNCGCPQPCPQPCPDPLDQVENIGCLQNINSECVTYNGENITCLEVMNGSDLNSIIKLMAEEICDLIDGVTGARFTCDKLNTCSINNLGDLVITTPTSGQVIGYNGTNWINITLPEIPEIPDPYEFSCTELAACSINSLGDVIITSPSSGQAVVFNGTNWVNQDLVSSIYTADSGITETANNFQLGGTLLQHTTINGNTNLYDLIVNNAKSFSVTSGTSPGTAGSTKAFYSFDLPTNYNSPGGYSVEFHAAKHYLNGYNLTNGGAINTHNVYSEYNVGGNITIGSGSGISGTVSTSRFKATAPNVNLTRTQAQAGATLIRHLYNHITFLQLDSGSTDVTEFVTFNKFANHAVTTNYDPVFESNKFDEFVQIYIGNAKGDATETTSLKMPDTYGIWQEGADDKNFFRGDIINSPLAGVGNRAVYSTANGTLTNSSSDETLKDDVTGLSYGLNTVMGLRPVSYNWIDKAKYGTQREIGFIAQEIIQYVPEVVGENASGTLSIDYPKLTAVLTNAIQELKNKVDLLQTQVTNLQNPPEQS